MSGRKGLKRAWAPTVDRFMQSHGEWKTGREIIAEATNSRGKTLATMRSCPSVYQLAEYFRCECIKDEPNYEMKLDKTGSFLGGKHEVNFYRWIA